jgi:hypothetical protein
MRKREKMKEKREKIGKKENEGRIFHFSFVPNMFPMVSHQVPKMFPSSSHQVP